MFKIGDFSQLGQISVRMLRHYDKMGLLKPGQVDKWTGYRYYTIEQLPRLHRIQALRDLGLSLQQVADLVEGDPAPDLLRNMLARKQHELQRALQEENARLRRVEARLRQIERAGEPLPYDVALKPVPVQNIIAVRAVVPALADMGEMRDHMLRQLYGWLDTQGVPYGDEIAVYHHQSYTDTHIDMSLGVLVQPALVKTLEESGLTAQKLPAAAQAASIIHRGAVWDIADVVSGLYQWLGTNGYASTGPFREIHLFGREIDVFAAGQQDDVVFEILVPVTRLQGESG